MDPIPWRGSTAERTGPDCIGNYDAPHVPEPTDHRDSGDVCVGSVDLKTPALLIHTRNIEEPLLYGV